ncbi:hypothetical protein A2115_01490 [Candidatus Woesebacteria bacterium GWA1_41_8]|uniref:Glycosyl transferase family 1 domain-containing protein n=1 Tax=Candidatus Woesebacteria bacterium GWA1_41_8 TaxID=1802471 RepID=A0A1F7WH55_9BACT|nr:MAG: hypothetical protein A2115_01490 [Candidatus Woesebacteria bacterium GWA1_41_8]
MEKPTIGVVRGTRQSVINFFEHFEKLNVRFIAASFKPFSYESTKANFELVSPPLYFPLKIDPTVLINQKGNLSWFFLKDLEKHLQGSDVVSISDTYYFMNLQAVDWAKKNGVPVVTVIWTTIPKHITSWFPPYSYITKRVIEATDLFILRNRASLAFTDSLSIPRKKVKVIYKGVDLAKFHPPLRGQAPGLNSGRRLPPTTKILFTGNLSKAKGLDDLLAVFSNIRHTNPTIRLIIAGDGEMRRKVEKLARKRIVDYRGFVSYDKLPDIYREADIYCAPSKFKYFLGIKVWEEYFSYALMEAQASGLPIIATKTGAIPEEVGKDNLLIESGNRGQLEKSLEKLIASAPLRQKLGLQNRKRAEKLFNAKKQASKTEEEILTYLR